MKKSLFHNKTFKVVTAIALAVSIATPMTLATNSTPTSSDTTSPKDPIKVYEFTEDEDIENDVTLTNSEFSTDEFGNNVIKMDYIDTDAEGVKMSNPFSGNEDLQEDVVDALKVTGKHFGAWAKLVSDVAIGDTPAGPDYYYVQDAATKEEAVKRYENNYKIQEFRRKQITDFAKSITVTGGSLTLKEVSGTAGETSVSYQAVKTEPEADMKLMDIMSVKAREYFNTKDNVDYAPYYDKEKAEVVQNGIKFDSNGNELNNRQNIANGNNLAKCLSNLNLYVDEDVLIEWSNGYLTRENPDDPTSDIVSIYGEKLPETANGGQTLEEYAGLTDPNPRDTTPEEYTFPYPTWSKGVTVSTWVKIPAATAEATVAGEVTEVAINPVVFEFTDSSSKAHFNLKSDGTFTFEGVAGAAGGSDEGKNTFSAIYQGETPLKNVGEWVYVTLTVENDNVNVYYNGEKAQFRWAPGYNNGQNPMKFFNYGTGYGKDDIDKRIADCVKGNNYAFLLKNFGADTDYNKDESYAKYKLNSYENYMTMVGFLTNKTTKFYLGGGVGNYTDYNKDMEIGAIRFYDYVVTDEDAAAQYTAAKDHREKKDVPTPTPTATGPATSTPTTTPGGGTGTSVSATLKKNLDFNKGLKEYNDDKTGVNLNIVTTENVLVHKPEAERGKDDRVDANDILIMGTGSGAYYKVYTVSNQPSSYFDSERGTVLYMGKTVHIDALMKTKSAGIEGDDAATAALDKAIPVSTGAIQPEMTVRSELNFNNPIADSTDSFSVSMWLKIPTVDGVTNTLAGNWHNVVVAVDGDNATYYLDKEVKEDTNVVDNIKAWVASGAKLSIGGTTESAKAFAAAFGITDENAAIMIDDLAFYTGAMTAEQVNDAYAKATTKAKPVAKKLTFNDFKDISELKDSEYPGITGEVTTKITTSTATEEAISVPENRKGTEGTGAYIDNPFAGKNLEGATISFWTKQEKRANKNSTGNETTQMLSIMDTTKSINHDKSAAKGNAWSLLQVSSDGKAAFTEGFSDKGAVGDKLKNTYVYQIGETDRAKYDVKDWYYVTIVMNNAGIKMYINGELYDNAALDGNGKSIAAGARFLDGYFTREADEQDATTKYNIFGGSNNQYATTLMSFLNYSDTKLFLGYGPSSNSLNNSTNPSYFSGIRTFDMALSEEQVKALYKDNTIYDEGGETPIPPTPGNTVLGDADLNGKVELNDVTITLKTALKLQKLEGQAFTNADANKDTKITLEDVTMILKAALKLTELK